MKRRETWLFYWFTIVLLAVSASFLFQRCSKVPDEEMSGAIGQPCIADSISALKRMPTVPPCEAGDWQCRAKCRAGSAVSCLALAYAAEKDPAAKAEAMRLYQRACLLGEANACTNYAASIWANDPSDEELACARRTFEKACAAKEPFACGMVGRLMLESKQPRFAEARKYLEAACDEVSGFPCRVLARHLESGKLGEYEPGLIRRLLAQACAAGDPDACGEPATALETFH
jgi:TPR repeat protein